MRTTTPRRTLVRSIAVAAAVAALGIAAAGSAAAATAPSSATASGSAAAAVDQSQTDVRVLAWYSTVFKGSTIAPPKMTCPPGHFLIDEDYSPGRWVPRGVQVVEPGGLGVTISNDQLEPTPDGVHVAAVGTETDGLNSVTNWDPFTDHDVEIYLNCTTDLDKTQLYPK